MIAFHPLAGALGAEVAGADLRDPIDEASLSALRDGLHRYQVLFFRDQEITPHDQLAFAKRFGQVVGHPAYPHVEGCPEVHILENTPEEPPKIDTWHTDMTFQPEPPLGTILVGRVIPEHGGDTMFASLGAAYESLSDRMQRYLEGLRATHSFAYGFRHSLAEPGGTERLAGAVRSNPPVTHPVVRTHPETGRKGLFVNRLFTTHLVGLSARESDAVLGFLFDHLETPELSCRFRWRPRSVAFWDNRATLHRPVNDFWPGHRRMERVTIAGDAPS